MNTDRVYVARREYIGIEHETYSKYEWDCFSRMRKMEKTTGFNDHYPFTDIVSFELNDPKVEVTFAISEPPKSQITASLLYEDEGTTDEGIN